MDFLTDVCRIKKILPFGKLFRIFSNILSLATRSKMLQYSEYRVLFLLQDIDVLCICILQQ